VFGCENPTAKYGSSYPTIQPIVTVKFFQQE